MSGQARDRQLDEREGQGSFYPENDLVRWLRQGADAIRPHLTTIAAVIAALLILWGYFAWRRASNETRRTTAWNEFFAEDYDAVISKYQDTEVAPFARMRIAEKSLNEGKSLLLSKRGEALKAFERAQTQLDAAASDPNAPADLRRNAALMKAMALEATGAPEKAKEQYEKVVSQYRDSPEGQQAKRRVEELSKKSAIDFYRQLANYKPGDRPARPNPVKEPNLDELLRGMGSPNPNQIVPSPPPVPTPPKTDSKDAGKAPEKSEPIPTPPPKKAAPAPAPGKDLPENEKKEPAKGEAPKPPATKPAEPSKK
jgi:tetratricopeptide (TPR) repeat protein